MPSASSARRESSEPADLVSAQLRSELVATLDEYGRASPSLDQVLGALAGLLIAKWAGHDDSEREAIAAFDGRSFTREIPEALRLPSWERSSGGHASSVAEALKEVLACRDAQGAFARYLACVAPIATRMVEHSRPTYERLYTWVCQLDLGSVEGRALAAHLFDDVLRTVMTRQGKLAGEFVTPEQAAALMLELADPRPEDRIYDPCFGFGELLVGVARRLRVAAWTTSPRIWSDVQLSGISGVEINRASYAVGLCRTLLAGIDRPDLELSDALGRPLPCNRAADGFRLHPRRSAVGYTGLASVRGPVPVPKSQHGMPVSAARDGEPAARWTSRCRIAGRSTLPTWPRATGEEGAIVRLSRGCRGFVASRRIFTLDWHCRQPPGFSPSYTATGDSLRQCLPHGVGISAGSRRRLHS